MVKRAFTLIEMIFVIVILSLLTMGGFYLAGKIYKRNILIRKYSEYELLTQESLDQLALLLYHRIPLSVIGYDPISGDYKYIGEIDSDKYKVLEWIGYIDEAMVDKNLSGFVDLYASNRDDKILKAIDFNYDFVNSVMQNKFGVGLDKAALIFAGSFDRGEEGILSDYNSSFGWHGGDANLTYQISVSSDGEDADITLKNFTTGRVYEKFYLADSAYAVARAGDLGDNWKCNIPKPSEDTLLLFYNYRPWLGETFCGDGGEGNVTILAKDVKAFVVRAINSHLEIKMMLESNTSNMIIRVSKQKVLF